MCRQKIECFINRQPELLRQLLELLISQSGTDLIGGYWQISAAA